MGRTVWHPESTELHTVGHLAVTKLLAHVIDLVNWNRKSQLVQSMITMKPALLVHVMQVGYTGKATCEFCLSPA